jgi:hypothetical protein
MARKKNGTKLLREPFEIKINLLARRTPDKKLTVCVRHTGRVHPDYALPSHCKRKASPDHQSIMNEDYHIDGAAGAGLSPVL